MSRDGVGNLAPHSFFTVACARPPIIQFTSVGNKDTLRNVINGSSAPFEPEVDEAAAVGVKMCTLHSTVELGDSTVVFGNVVTITVRTEVLEDSHPAFGRLQPLSRLGRNEWGLPPETVAIDRPGSTDDVIARACRGSGRGAVGTHSGAASRLATVGAVLGVELDSVARQHRVDRGLRSLGRRRHQMSIGPECESRIGVA